MNKYLLLFSALTLNFFCAISQVIYVKANATGANDGTSWANAFTSLQSALPLATSSNEIWVAQGVYKPHASDRTVAFSPLTETKLYGGFIGTETLRAQRNPSLNITTLSGDLLGNDNATIDISEATRQDNSYNIFSIVGGSFLNIIVDGFTISSANANGASGLTRSGAVVIQPGNFKTITTFFTNVIFEKHAAMESAVFMGITTRGNNTNCIGEFHLANSIIRDNKSGSSSTLNYTGTHVNSFGQNSYDRISGSIKNSLFHSNISTSTASCIRNVVNGGSGSYAPLEVFNCTFTENIGSSDLVLYLSSATTTKIKNSIIYNNGSLTPVFMNNSGPIASMWSNNIVSDPVFGINQSPLFRNAAAKDYRFDCTANSPGIDGGTTATVPSLDLLNQPRTINTIDIGCYEYQHQIIVSATDTNLCPNESVTLTSQYGTGKTWNNGVVEGVAFTPTITKTYSVTGTDENLCLSTKSITITVNTILNQTVTTTADTICSGDSINIQVGGSEIGFIYKVKDTVTQSIVAGPTVGTGAALNFPINNITSNKTYAVEVKKLLTNNGALDLDGVDDYVNLGTSNRNITSTITISARVKTTVNGASQFIVAKYLSGSLGFYLVINNTGYATIQGRDVTGTIKSSGFSTTMVADNQWHEITGVVRSTGWEIYVDGVLEKSTAYSLGVTGLGTSAPFLAGQFNSTYSAMDIDQIAVWNTALSSASILSNYTTCLSGNEANLVAFLKFDETSGTNVTDYSPTAINGTLINMTAPACWTTGGIDNCEQSCSKDLSTLVKITVTTPPAQPTITAGGSTTICSGDTLTLTSSSAASYLWSNGATTQTIKVTSGGTFTVRVKNLTGCESVQSAATTVTTTTPPAQPTITAGGATTFCSGDSVTLTSSSGNSYLWSNGATTQAIKVKTSGTFTVKVINAAGCQSIASAGITVTVNAIPIAAISPATITICNGKSATLTASGGGTYAWSNSGGSNAQATFSPSNTTTYTVTVTSANNCSATASKTVTVNSSPTANISPASVTICNGENATLTASGGGTYAWSNSLGSGASKTVSPSSTITYTVTITNANNCTATASKLVTVNTLPTASIQPATVTLCSGASATLTASGGGTYTWSNGGGSNAQATFTPTSTTTYTVTVTNANNCSATASKTVTVNSNPTASIQPATVTLCSGASATLTASGGGTYAWSNSGGSNAQATFTPALTTTYTVTVTNANNCSATASRTVTVNQTPNASINGPTTICSGLPATLTASGGNSYTWSNGGGNNAQATFTPSSTTTYSVTVTGTGNCTATASQTVSVQSSPTATISGATSVCTGDSITLTANGGNTYTWANGLGSNASIKVSPTSTTTYTVTVSIGVNCTATTSHTVTLKHPSANTLNQTICAGNSFSFNGNQLTVGGTYLDTLTNAAGCDSIVTLNLIVTPALQGSLSKTICTGNSFSFNGNLLTVGGVYLDTLSNGSGCDSVVTLTLTVTPALQGAFSETICFGDVFTFNSLQLSQSGQYKDTLQTNGGCDSIVTLNLIVLNKIENTINAQICTGQNYNFNGQQLVQSGQYFDTLQTALGCDSFIVLNLTVNSFVTENISAAICTGDSYSFNGQTLIQGGLYNDTLTSSGGCDSIVVLTLTVNTLPVPTITQNGNQLSTQTFSNYQWQLNGSDINSAMTQNYTAVQNGNYTVEVTDTNGCINTSAAVNVTGVGITEITEFKISVFPNPTAEKLNVECNEQITFIEVSDALGRVLVAKNNLSTQNLQLNTQLLAEATYFIQIKTINGSTIRKSFIKQ